MIGFNVLKMIFFFGFRNILNMTHFKVAQNKFFHIFIKNELV